MKQTTNHKDSNSGLGELHPKEVGLIYMIRHLYRFGSIEISTADGLPKQIRKREYTYLIPDGVLDEDPMKKVQEVYEFLAKLSTSPQIYPQDDKKDLT